jgi:hypothetical protein
MTGQIATKQHAEQRVGRQRPQVIQTQMPVFPRRIGADVLPVQTAIRQGGAFRRGPRERYHRRVLGRNQQAVHAYRHIERRKTDQRDPHRRQLRRQRGGPALHPFPPLPPSPLAKSQYAAHEQPDRGEAQRPQSRARDIRDPIHQRTHPPHRKRLHALDQPAQDQPQQQGSRERRDHAPTASAQCRPHQQPQRDIQRDVGQHVRPMRLPHRFRPLIECGERLNSGQLNIEGHPPAPQNDGDDHQGQRLQRAPADAVNQLVVERFRHRGCWRAVGARSKSSCDVVDCDRPRGLKPAALCRCFANAATLIGAPTSGPFSGYRERADASGPIHADSPAQDQNRRVRCADQAKAPDPFIRNDGALANRVACWRKARPIPE